MESFLLRPVWHLLQVFRQPAAGVTEGLADDTRLLYTATAYHALAKGRLADYQSAGCRDELAEREREGVAVPVAPRPTPAKCRSLPLVTSRSELSARPERKRLNQPLSGSESPCLCSGKKSRPWPSCSF